jgi:hypothetical protein
MVGRRREPLLLLAGAALCMLLATAAWGCGGLTMDSAADRIGDQGFYYGLWADNVEVIPSHPTILPADFFDKKPAIARIPVDSQGQPLMMDPAKINRPLWVFADEVSLQSVADTIHAAQAANRPIVIVGAEESLVEEILRESSPWTAPADIPPARIGWSWLPWMASRLTAGQLGSASGWNPSSEERSAAYYQFLVESTLRLETVKHLPGS